MTRSEDSRTATTVSTALTAILRREGGYIDHPQDRGGPTNYGITQATLAAWRRQPVTVSDVRDLTRDEARAIYHDRYLAATKIDTLPPWVIAHVLDFAVHSGHVVAISHLQRALGVTADGVIGPQTRGAAEACTPRPEDCDAVHRTLATERTLWLAGVVAQDPTQVVFLVGWIRRALAFLHPPV